MSDQNNTQPAGASQNTNRTPSSQPTQQTSFRDRRAATGFNRSARTGAPGAFGNRNNRPGGFNSAGPNAGGNRGPNDRNRGGFGGRRNDRAPRDRKPREDEFSDFTSEVIDVRRVTRVVKGGKRMRFSALVVIGDKNGRIGFGLRKGLDFQDAVAKATREAKKTLIRINLDEAKSLPFPIDLKYKSSRIMLKPAQAGTGLIAGGFIRPILTLAGYENVYSKIIGSSNKIVGVQSVFKALEKFVK